jgi:hypothetical protein
VTGVRKQRSQRSTSTSKCHVPSEINHLPLTLKNPHFTRLCIYVLRMTLKVNNIISLNSVNNLEFYVTRRSIFCKARSEILNIIWDNIGLQLCHDSDGKGPTSYREGPGSIPGQSKGDLWRKSSTRTVSSRSTSVFSCQYHSSNVPYSFSYVKMTN